MTDNKALKKAAEEAAEAYCIGNTDGEPYSEYEKHFFIAGAKFGADWQSKRDAEKLKIALEALKLIGDGWLICGD